MAYSEPAARAVAEEVARWGGMRQTGVTLRYMMEFGARPTERNLLRSAQFLRRELPIRIARRALDLDSLPFGLSTKPAILKVTTPPPLFSFPTREDERRMRSAPPLCVSL